MSEKSMGNAHNDASEAKKAPNHSASQPQRGFCSCKTSYERYNAGKSEQKKKFQLSSYALKDLAAPVSK